MFDFDYTLGDSTKGIISSVNFALNKLEYQKKDEEIIRKTIGLSLKDTFFELEPEGKESEAEETSREDFEPYRTVHVGNGIKDIYEKLKA